MNNDKNSTIELNTRLRKLRESKHLSLEHVADFLGVPISTYATWEHTTIPKASYLPGLAKLYGISIDELLGMTSLEKEGLLKMLAWAEEANQTKDKLITHLENENQRLRENQ